MALLERPVHDALLVGAMARGDAEAAASFVDRHVDGVYGLLRMVLGGVAVDAATCQTFLTAIERSAELPPDGSRDAGDWLAELALEEVEMSWSAVERHGDLDITRGPHDPVAAIWRAVPQRGRGQPSPPEAARDSELLEGVDDHGLGVLIRALEVRCRQALVLSTLRGLDRAVVARFVGVAPEEVPRLERAALNDLRRMLSARPPAAAAGPEISSATAAHLRRLPVFGRGGMVVVRGTRAYLAPSPTNGLLHVAVQAIRRLLAAIRNDPVEPPGIHDSFGAVSIERPGPTAGTMMPSNRLTTPSILTRRMPGATPGTKVLRSPRRTPSTEDIVLPDRPSRPGSGAWSGRW